MPTDRHESPDQANANYPGTQNSKQMTEQGSPTFNGSKLTAKAAHCLMCGSMIL